MEKDQIFILEDRGVLYINGKDSKEFLQNIITNDMEKVDDNFSCFTSLLSPQGKYLFDFMIIKHKQVKLNSYTKDWIFINCALK